MRNLPLTLIHVIPAPTADAVQFVSPAVRAEIHRRHESEARRVIADAIEVAGGVAGRGPDVSGEVLRGPTVPTLVELSKDARMLAVGSRGLGTLGRAILGSVSMGLMQRTHCPIAVIRDGADRLARPHRLPVVLGVDGSPTSELATEIAFDEASWRGVELVAVHAFSDMSLFAPSDRLRSDLQVCAEAVLAERLAGYQERYPDVTVQRLVVVDHPADHLLEQAESAQLVVVGSHGRGGFAGMLLGSVSTSIIYSAHTPVIVARQC